MPTPAHELYIRCRTKTLDLLRRLPYTNTTAARGCSNQQEINMSPTYTDPVLVERMPEHLRDSHRAAGSWGRYPANGAERVIVERADTEAWSYDAEADAHSNIEADEYDHIVRAATPADFDQYAVEIERVEDIGGEVARTAEVWWAWHDRDQARWSQTVEEAEARCDLWVAGESDDGP